MGKNWPQGLARNSSHYVRWLIRIFLTRKHHSWKELEKGTGARTFQAGWKAEEGRIKALEEEGGQSCNGLERVRCIKQQGSLLSSHCCNGAFVLLLSCSRTSQSIRAADRSWINHSLVSAEGRPWLICSPRWLALKGHALITVSFCIPVLYSRSKCCKTSLPPAWAVLVPPFPFKCLRKLWKE